MNTPALYLGSAVALAATLIFLTPSSAQGSYVPTYYVDVQPILQQHCVSCHVAGGIAPFALDNPKDAAQWASRIAAVTQSEYMPPWPPARDSEPFLNERRLGSASKQILQDWARANAPLGQPPRK
jgi:mono/diheme cytochrome c family protein